MSIFEKKEKHHHHGHWYEPIFDSLVEHDKFGGPVSINFDGKNEKVNTAIGGFITILSSIAVIFFIIIQIMVMFNRTNNEFYVSDYIIDSESFRNKTMDEFDDTFNLFIGTTNKDLNWFHNPYIEVNVYEFDEKFEMKLSKDVKLKQCSEEDYLQFLNKAELHFYQNSLCMENKK